MKKLPLLLSLVLAAALLLAACGGNANNGATPLPGEEGALPGDTVVDETLDPAAPADDVVDATPTVMVEEPVVVETPTEVTEDVEETPVADAEEEGVPVTGEDAGDYCYPNRLTHLVGAEVAGADGSMIGEVEGVIVNRGAVVVTTEDAIEGEGADTDATETPVADDAGLAVDPAMQAGSDVAPRVSYLLIDVADDFELFEEDRDILVPFGALTVTPERTELVDTDNCVFTMAQDVQTLVDAPFFEDNLWEDELDLSMPDWDLAYNTYWTEQGIIVGDEAAVEGDTETAAGYNEVLLRDGFTINVSNLEDDDLGTVDEFIIDPTTGDFTHAILARGGLLGVGGSNYAVPMNQLTWVQYQDDAADAEFDIDNLGEFLLDLNEEDFDGIEGIDDVDMFDFTAPDWSVDYDAFWMNRVPVENE